MHHEDPVLKNSLFKILLVAIFVTVATGSCFAKKHKKPPSDQLGTLHSSQDSRECRPEQKNCYRFRAEDQAELRDHYQYNWLTPMPTGEHLVQFKREERLGVLELRRLKVVPEEYSRNVPPPPPGYRFGYYNGMVYAYNPTTGVVADAVDVRHR